MPRSLSACTRPLEVSTWTTAFLRRHGWMPFADGTWARSLRDGQKAVPTCEAVNQQVTKLELHLIAERWDRALTLPRAYEALFELEAASAPLILEHFGRPWVVGFVAWLSEVADGTRSLFEGREPNDFQRRHARLFELELLTLGVTHAG